LACSRSRYWRSYSSRKVWFEEEAEKSRVKVREMFAAYRPAALGNGNGFQSQDAMVSESVRQKFAAYRPSTPMP